MKSVLNFLFNGISMGLAVGILGFASQGLADSVESASDQRLCGRVSASTHFVYLVRDHANLGTDGGYPTRTVYLLEDDEDGALTKQVHRLNGDFVCVSGYEDLKAPDRTFVITRLLN